MFIKRNRTQLAGKPYQSVLLVQGKRLPGKRAPGRPPVGTPPPKSHRYPQMNVREAAEGRQEDLVVGRSDWFEALFQVRVSSRVAKSRVIQRKAFHRAQPIIWPKGWR